MSAAGHGHEPVQHWVDRDWMHRVELRHATRGFGRASSPSPDTTETLQLRGNSRSGPLGLYWTSTVLVVVVFVAAAAACWWASARSKSVRAQDPRRIRGLASRAEVGKVAGTKALIARGADLRPSLTNPHVTDLGFRLPCDTAPSLPERRL